MKIKVSFGDDIRRFEAPAEAESSAEMLLQALRSFVREAFGVNSFLLKYTDDEDELVTIAHASELDEAVRIAEEEQRKSLRIFVAASGAQSVPNANASVLSEEKESVSAPPQPEQEQDADTGASSQENGDESVEDRPTCEMIGELFTMFLQDDDVQKALPEAVKLLLSSLRAQQQEGTGSPSFQRALDEVFAAFPVIRDHEFIQSVSDKLPAVCEKADKFVPMIVSLDPEFVAAMIPRVLSTVGNFQEHGMAGFAPLFGHFSTMFPGMQMPGAGAAAGAAGAAGAAAGAGGCPMAQGGFFGYPPMGGPGAASGVNPLLSTLFSMMSPQAAASRCAEEDPVAPSGAAEEEETADEKDGEVIHRGVECDLCGVAPIVGVRFKCAECPNFDLCAECEAKGDPADFVGGDHSLRHVMVKFRKSQMHPFARFYNSRFPHRGGARGWRQHCRGAGGRGRHGMWARRGGGRCGRQGGRHGGRDQQKKCDKFKATSVEDVTLPKGAVVLAGEQVVKTWSVTNNGDKAWPEGTVIQHFKGDRFAAFEMAVPSCAPGGTVEISLPLDVLKVPGSYMAKYRLKTPKEAGGRKFGKPLIVRIEVVADQVLEEKVEAPAPSAPAVDPVVDAQQEEPASAPAAEEEEVPVLEFKYQEQLDMLMQMGFGNVELNKVALENQKGDVQGAVDEIIRILGA